ncbi:MULTISPECIES: dihydrofolate reductase family protein [Gordonia]|uniref:Dihydrofolate reductase family protein n=1 Tax=Gordonia amicalis TaxID=89053 RepID=A0AAE4R964_9ACTN|nr:MULTISPECIES: dihydrofolate reductase family protein [Gordonia]ATD71170.1 dihydrofolate reductase [Gordonia sp. 1D]MCR8897542.1 dihydrofolate reductase family protein [Gordonia sp. GONU]MCZ0912844.1 dihydrofolate reductase family protein [Gordonia amicalis]MCZ4579714.1 dihydrofolate reductase family protein [Gordonia amicalis]MCZ4652290.1 dihydrofolate reductase family protein [Gordonia amicalis]
MAFRYYTATTLDGYLADDHDSLDWLLTQPLEDGGAMNYDDFFAGIGTAVMGYTTYQWLLDNEMADGKPWPYEIPSFVFTHRTITPVADSITVLDGDPTAHRDLLTEAAAGKDVWVVGGGDLAAQFAEAGMLDDMIVSIAPVTLGSGRPLFPRRYDLALQEFGRNGAFLCARYSLVGARKPLAEV